MSGDNMGIQVAPSGTVGVRGPDVLDAVTMQKKTRTDGSSKLHVGWEEHASFTRLLNGSDVFFGPQYDVEPTGELVVENLQTGKVTALMGPSTGWPYPPSAIHPSGVAFKNPGWVALSIVGGDPGDGVMSTGIPVLEQELVLANLNTGDVCRVAHHYSVRTSQEYWGEPHVVISPTGTRLLFASDWRNSDSVDTYVVELPSYPSNGTSPQPPPPPPTPSRAKPTPSPSVKIVPSSSSVKPAPNNSTRRGVSTVNGSVSVVGQASVMLLLLVVVVLLLSTL